MSDGWTTKKLVDLATIELGKTPSRADASLWDDGRVTGNVWLSIADLLDATDSVVSDSKEYVSKKGATLCKTVPKGTLLVSFKLTLGRLAFAGRNLFTNEAIAALSLFNEREVSKEYLYHFFQHFDWDAATEGDVKLKGKTLNKAKLKEIEIKYPPLPEQQRIVGILDEAFAAIATAKANTEKNLANARALFESHLQAVFSQNTGEWSKHIPLENLTEEDSPITYGVVKPGEEGDVVFVRGGDLSHGRVLMDQLRTITSAFSKQYRRTLLRGGELLISLVGQPGQVAVAPPELAGANIARQVGLIRLRSTMDAEFVRFFLQSPVGQELLGARQSGSVQQVINLGELRQVQVPCPALATQRRVVAMLSAFAIETQRLESLAIQKLAALDALKKSLLHQAFSGQLALSVK